MDFDLTEEQQLLRDVTRDAAVAQLRHRKPLQQVIDSELGWSREVWKQLAEMGMLGLGFDPDEAGQIEVMVVMTEIGRRLAPEPVAQAALIPGGLIAELGTDEQKEILDDVAGGRDAAGLRPRRAGCRTGRGRAQHRAERRRLVDGHRSQKPCAGRRFAPTRSIVTAALPDGGSGLFLVDARRGDAARLPHLRRSDAAPNSTSTPSPPSRSATGGDAAEHIARTVIRYQSALCAEAVGAMEEALRLTTGYLGERKQFGVPLSNFQTLTQRAADMYVSLELARSMSFYAAMSIADGRFDPVVAARAKLQIGRSGRHIAQEAIQLHGGIGMTAEYPVGHYAARLTAIDNTFGTADDQIACARRGTSAPTGPSLCRSTPA